ncbi:hypothetical protein BDW67DRAFT_179379 [Aspergillus spinulosporus]
MTLPNASPKPQIPRVTASEDTTTVQKYLEDVGAVILEGAFTHETIQDLNRDLDPAFDATDLVVSADHAFQPVQSKYVFNLPVISKTFRHDILNSPALHGVARSFFEGTGDYWLTAASSGQLYPGHAPQELHRDESLTHPLVQYQTPGAPPITLSFIIALTEFTKNNGGTRVVLGSHKRAEMNYSTDEAVPAEMKPGDVLALSQGVVHAGGPHSIHIPHPRRTALLFFGSCQLTQVETYMMMPRGLVETMTPLAQQMIGWRSLKPPKPNVAGIHLSNSKFIEDVLDLKSNQPLGDGM